MKTKLLRWIAAICVSMCVTLCLAKPINLPREWLSKLQAVEGQLDGVYPWCFEIDIVRGDNEEILEQICKLLGACGIGDHWAANDYRRVDAIAQRADVPLVLTTLPWNRKGTPFCTQPSTVEDTVAEAQFVLDKLTMIRDLGLSQPIVAVIIGTECQVGTKVRNLIYSLIYEIFPDAEIIWYRNGDWNEAKDAISMSRVVQLYAPQSVKQTEQRLTLMIEEFPDERYGAFIAVGPCYVGSVWHWKCPEMTLDAWSWFARWWQATKSLKVTVLYSPGHPSTDIDSFLAFMRGVTGQPLE